LCNLVAQSPGTAKEQFWREVQKELSARETEASELVYFKLYKSEIPLSSTRSKAVLTSTNGYLLFPGRMGHVEIEPRKARDCSGSSERPQLLVCPRLVSASWAVPAENICRANGLCHRS